MEEKAVKRSVCFFSFFLWLAVTLTTAPQTSYGDPELKAKTKKMFKDTGEVFKHIYRKTKNKTIKVVHKIDHKLGGDEKEGGTSPSPKGSP